MEYEIDEEEPPLTPGERVLDPSSLHRHRQTTADLKPRRQGSAKVTARRSSDNRRYPASTRAASRGRRSIVAKLINCECGQVVRGETDDELVAATTRHVGEHHPDLVGKLSREDILAMAEDA
jgi:hypothetical protein